MKELKKGKVLGTLGILKGKKKPLFFPLHDRSRLQGKDYSNLLVPIREVKEYYDEIKSSHITASLRYQILDDEPFNKLEVKDKDAAHSVHNRSRMKKQKAVDLHKTEHTIIAVDRLKVSKKKALHIVKLVNKLSKPSSPLIEAIKKVSFGKEIKNPTEKERELAAKSYMAVYGEILNLFAANDEILVNNLWQALETSQPLRGHIIPTLKNRSLESFSLKRELSVKYPLSKVFNFKLFNSFKNNPESALRDYFGEEITLFFDFMTFYRDRLFWPIIFGIIVAIISLFDLFVQKKPLQRIIRSVDFNWMELVHKTTVSLFSVYITFWSLRFITAWRRFESEFAVKYGQTTIETKKEVRPNFVGEFTRSVTNDVMNDMADENTKIRFHKVLTLIVFLAFTALTYYASQWVLYLKRAAYIHDWTRYNIIGLDLDQVLGDIVEYFRIMVFQWVFFRLISKFITMENLKFVEDYERQLLMYFGIYTIINIAAHPIMIGIQHVVEYIEWARDPDKYYFDNHNAKGCINDLCAAEMGHFFGTWSVFQLAYNIITKCFVIPAFRTVAGIKNASDPLSTRAVTNRYNSKIREDTNALLKANKLEEEKKDQDFEKLANGSTVKDFGISDKDVEKQKVAEIVTQYYTENHKIYKLVDMEIDYQVRNLSDFNELAECEQMLLDYLDVFSSFSVYTMFGILFPICFLIGFINATIEWVVARNWLMNQTRRPKPSAAKSIGLWLEMIRIVSILSIVTNCFYISFVLFESFQLWIQYTAFLGGNIGLFILHYCVSQYTFGLSEKVEISMARAEFVQGLLFTKDKSKTAGSKKLKISMAFNLFGKVELPRRSTNVFDVVVKKEGEGGTQNSGQKIEDGHEDQGASGEGKTKLEDGDGHDISHGQNNKDGEKVEGVNAGPVPK